MKHIQRNSLDMASMCHRLCCKFRVWHKLSMLYRCYQIKKIREDTCIDQQVFSWTWGHSCSMGRCHLRLQSKKSDRDKMYTRSHLYRLNRNLNRANKCCSKYKYLSGSWLELRILHSNIVSQANRSIYPRKDRTRACMKYIAHFLLRMKYNFRRKVQ